MSYNKPLFIQGKLKCIYVHSHTHTRRSPVQSLYWMSFFFLPPVHVILLTNKSYWLSEKTFWWNISWRIENRGFVPRNQFIKHLERLNLPQTRHYFILQREKADDPYNISGSSLFSETHFSWPTLQLVSTMWSVCVCFTFCMGVTPKFSSSVVQRKLPHVILLEGERKRERKWEIDVRVCVWRCVCVHASNHR